MKNFLVARYSTSAISYYSAVGSYNLNLRILFYFLKYLKWSGLNFIQYERELLEKKHLETRDGDAIYTDVYFIEKNLVELSSTYTTDPEEINSRLKYYYIYTKREFKDYKYAMSLENFLQILKDFLNCAQKQISYIIIYEDNKKKIHCKEYKPTPEELKEWGARFSVDVES